MDQLNPDDDSSTAEYEAAGHQGTDSDRLTPRVAPAARRRRKNPIAGIALAVIVVALGVVVVNGLGDATLFFRNTDEAVAQRDSLGDRRFRIQGLVDGDTITPTPGGADFVITYNGVDVTVVLQTDPPDLFQPGIPVVLEGRWAHTDEADATAPQGSLPTDDGWFFLSDHALAKHTEVYEEDNPDRVEDYVDADYGGDEEAEAGSAR